MSVKIGSIDFDGLPEGHHTCCIKRKGRAAPAAPSIRSLSHVPNGRRRAYPLALAQLSLRPSVRLNTSRPGAESGSGQK